MDIFEPHPLAVVVQSQCLPNNTILLRGVKKKRSLISDQVCFYTLVVATVRQLAWLLKGLACLKSVIAKQWVMSAKDIFFSSKWNWLLYFPFSSAQDNLYWIGNNTSEVTHILLSSLFTIDISIFSSKQHMSIKATLVIVRYINHTNHPYVGN